MYMIGWSFGLVLEHVGGCSVEALAQIELKREAGVALAAFAGHQLQPVDLHELPLERGSDVARHRLGAGAGIVDVYLNDRIVDRRQIVDRKLGVAKHSKQHRGQGQDRGHHGAPDEWLRKTHRLASRSFAFPALLSGEPFGPAGCSIRTFPPGVTAICPAVITRSPSFSPWVIATSSPCRCPTVTGRISAVESSFTT